MFRSLKQLIPHHFFLRIWYHKCISFLAACIYGFPAKNMTVIAVTGTDGKTTTCKLIHSILQASGIKSGLATTIDFAIGDHIWQNHTHKTTLGRFHLQKLIYKMKKQGCTHLVLETSSHALDQGRLTAIPIDVAVITNLSHEHLDYHKTLDNYRQSKLKLFSKLIHSRTLSSQNKAAIYNRDDQNTYQHIFDMMQTLDNEKRLNIQYSINKEFLEINDNSNYYYYAKNIQCSTKNTQFDITYEKSQKIRINLKLLGKHNVANALAAISTAKALNIPADALQRGLKSVQAVPGRFEIVTPQNHPFTVIIDYAVTENAFKKMFETSKTLLNNNGRLIAVFGACGDRDQVKRPKLGHIASLLCDIVIVTDEEPYSENPASIRNMITEGINKDICEFYEIEERKQAIKKAIDKATTGDIIIITGMGDQTSMIVGNQVVDWSDRRVVQTYI